MKHSFNFLSGLPLWPVGWRERSPVALAKSNQIRADQCERATEFLRSLLVGLGGACIDDAIEWRLSLDSFASEGTKLLRLLRSLVPRLCRPIWVVKMFFSISWRGSKGLKRAVLAVSWSESKTSRATDFITLNLRNWSTWDILRPETAVWYGLSSLIYPDWAACWWSNRIMMSSCWDCKSLSHNLHKPDPKIVPDTVLESRGWNAPEKHRKTLKPHIEAWELEKNIGKQTRINFQKCFSFLSFLSAILSTNMMDHGWQVDNQMLWGKQLAEHEEFRWHQWRSLPSWRSQGVKAEVHGGLWISYESSSVFRFQVFRLVSDCAPLSVNYKSDRRSELVKSRRMDSTICTAVQNEVIANTVIQIMHEWSRPKWTIKYHKITSP